MLPTNYELLQLFYQAKTAYGVLNITKTDAALLSDVKSNWRKASKVIRNAADSREYEMTLTEITADNTTAANDKIVNDAALVVILQNELTAETAGFNRSDVITTIQNDIVAHGGVLV